MVIINLLTLTLAGALFSILSIQSVVSAEIIVTPPPNWQPNPDNNSTRVAWSQNTSRSFFGIVKAPDSVAFPLLFVGPGMAQFLAEKGILESVEQLAFGKATSATDISFTFLPHPNSTLLVLWRKEVIYSK